MYSLIDGRVTEDSGSIGIQHSSVSPSNIMVSKTVYNFSPRNQVCFAWVLPEHVDKILALKTKGS